MKGLALSAGRWASMWLIFGPIVRFILEEGIKRLIALVDASFPKIIDV
jgi:hypothetical protein